MPEEKKIDTARFVDKGDTVVMKQNRPEDLVLDSKDLLVALESIKDAITKEETKIQTLKQNIKDSERFIEGNSVRVKELSKFEEKMRIIQESKAKTIFEDIKTECCKKVENEYTEDDALTEDMNNKQKWRIYQNIIATHKRVAEELAPKIMQKMYFKDHILDHPWK